MGKLVVSVKEADESIVIDLGNGDEIVFYVSRVRGKRVQVSLDVPRRFRILRQVRESPAKEKRHEEPEAVSQETPATCGRSAGGEH